MMCFTHTISFNTENSSASFPFNPWSAWEWEDQTLLMGVGIQAYGLSPGFCCCSASPCSDKPWSPAAPMMEGHWTLAAVVALNVLPGASFIPGIYKWRKLLWDWNRSPLHSEMEAFSLSPTMPGKKMSPKQTNEQKIHVHIQKNKEHKSTD